MYFARMHYSPSPGTFVRVKRLAKDTGSRSLVEFEYFRLFPPAADSAYLVTFSYPMRLNDVSRLIIVIINYN